MKAKLFNSKFVLILIFFLIPTSFLGCNKKDAQSTTPKQISAETTKSTEKVPDLLKELEDNIENIIVLLNGPAVLSNAGDNKNQTENSKSDSQQNEIKQEETQKEESEAKNSDKEGSTKENGDNKDSQKEESTQKQSKNTATDPLESVTPIINKIHYQWNSFFPTALKSGASKALTDNFSTALNSLTNTIIGKNKTNILLASNLLYSNIPSFYSLYNNTSITEIKKIRYYTRNAMLNAMTANWVQADTDINSLKSTWSMSKNILSSHNKDSSTKLDLSLLEFEKVIKEKNQPLSDIKGRVLLANISELEKYNEENNNQ